MTNMFRVTEAESEGPVSHERDRQLFAALAAGGRQADEALATLYDDFARRLLGLLRARGFQLEEAEEIVHESFLKLYEAGSKLEDVESPKSYLYRTVLNSSADFLRVKQRSRNEIGVEPAELDGVDGESGSDENKGFMECFELAFAEFEAGNPDRATVIRLAVIEGFSGPELAEAIGRSYGAAREFLSQTRKKFRDLLKTRCGDYIAEGKEDDG